MVEIRTVEQYAVQQKLQPRIRRIAAELRDLADAVEREGHEVDRIGQPGRDTYAQNAAKIQRLVMNVLPNLGLDALTTDAAEADVARAKGE